jgi:hypothetical protein
MTHHFTQTTIPAIPTPTAAATPLAQPAASEGAAPM